MGSSRRRGPFFRNVFMFRREWNICWVIRMLQAMASLGSYVESGEQIWCWRLIKPTWSVGYVTFGCIEKYVTGQVQFSTSERKGITTNGWNWVKITKSADALHWLNLAMGAMYVTYFTNVLCTTFGSDSETLKKSTSIKQSVRLLLCS